MDQLVVSTCMAPNMDGLCADLALYLTKHASMPVVSIIDLPWQERERLFDLGKIDLCWICGLPYVWKADQTPGKMEPLVAPVMAGSRYQNQPIYYSDVVVRQGSAFQHLADLHGAAWAINEPGSHSGYGVVRYTLAGCGETLDFFGQVIQSGAHQTSLAMILNGEVDGSAIDSTVLELEMALHPEIAGQIRIIDTLGPSPIPPWVISLEIPLEIRQSLRNVLAQMHTDPEGIAILKKVGMARFVAVNDSDYDPIRGMARMAFETQPRG